MFAPEGATHFRLTGAAAVINFAENSRHTTIADSGPLPLESTILAALHLQHKLESTDPGPVFLLLGIEFLQSVNNTFCPLKNENHNGMAIIRVVHLPS